jgi:hypothetical protein
VIDDVRMNFTALREAPPPHPGDLTILRMAIDDRVSFGIDADGRPHLLLTVSETLTVASGIPTVDIGTRSMRIGGEDRTVIDVVCLLATLDEVFDHFVAAIVERLIVPATEPEAAVETIVEKWRLFLIPAPAPPGRDKLASMFGELTLLCDVVARDPHVRIDCWVGPFRARHDLRRGDVAVEVKTTRSHTSRVVTIHGEDQLLEPDGGELFLHLVRLEEVAGGGRSVPALVDVLLQSGVQAEALFSALAAGGVPPAELPQTDGVRFDVRERLTVPVDAASPRIVPATFVGGARPVGVDEISYKVDLDHVLDRALEPGALGALIARLAGVDES